MKMNFMFQVDYVKKVFIANTTNKKYHLVIFSCWISLAWI